MAPPPKPPPPPGRRPPAKPPQGTGTTPGWPSRSPATPNPSPSSSPPPTPPPPVPGPNTVTPPRPVASPPTATAPVGQGHRISRRFLIATGLLGVLAFGVCTYFLLPGSGFASGSDGDVLREIDLATAHPEDPTKPEDIPGRTDRELSAYDDESVDALLSEEVIDAALVADDPRYLFGLGRVAMLHGQDDLAADLLGEAVNLGSAGAHMYYADYFEDDPDYALELLGFAIENGFEPASEAWDYVAATMESADGSNAAGSTPPQASPASIDYKVFQQPSIMAMFHQGRVPAGGLKLIMPASTPDFLTNSPPQLRGWIEQRLVTMYTAHLVIALNEKAVEENPIYLPQGTPLLALLVDANLAGVARIRLDTEEMLIFNKGGGLVAELGALMPYLKAGQKLMNGSGTGEEFKETLVTFGREYLQQDKRKKEFADLSKTFEDAGKIDAVRLQGLYYYGNTNDVKAIYHTIGKFINDR